MLDIPDPPEIRKMETFGTLHPEIDDDEETICPICGAECGTAYIGDDGDALGCENCVQKKDPWDDMRYQPKRMARSMTGGW